MLQANDGSFLLGAYIDDMKYMIPVLCQIPSHNKEVVLDWYLKHDDGDVFTKHLYITPKSITYIPSHEIVFTLPYGCNPEKLHFCDSNSPVSFPFLNHYLNISKMLHMPVTIYFSYGTYDGKAFCIPSDEHFLHSIRDSYGRDKDMPSLPDANGFVWKLNLT